MSSTPTRSLEYWYNYLEIFLGIDCLVLACFTVAVLIKQKVYKTWSTTAILISCSLLLLTRALCLFYYAI